MYITCKFAVKILIFFVLCLFLNGKSKYPRAVLNICLTVPKMVNVFYINSSVGLVWHKQHIFAKHIRSLHQDLFKGIMHSNASINHNWWFSPQNLCFCVSLRSNTFSRDTIMIAANVEVRNLTAQNKSQAISLFFSRIRKKKRRWIRAQPLSVINLLLWKHWLYAQHRIFTARNQNKFDRKIHRTSILCIITINETCTLTNRNIDQKLFEILIKHKLHSSMNGCVCVVILFSCVSVMH